MNDGNTTNNTKEFPSLFVSHGAPSLALDDNEAVAFMHELGRTLGRPKAILCVSAHWETDIPTVSAAEHPETIHDFGGFPEAMYQLRYPAPGAPALAARVTELLEEAGIPSKSSPDRGLDHGAWVPLMLIYPDADIPVAQLSVQRGADPAYHYRIGQALARLRQEGVLVLATGSAVHNLRMIQRENTPPEWALEFDNWLYEKITEGRYAEALDYRQKAPNSTLAHPTDEHLLPLFVAMGAGAGVGDDHPHGTSLHRSWTFGSLSMAAYSFG
jgi:4,5-DOPA dioxygenase extradiol